MFGYITPLKPELKIKDFTRFRAYYCGVCISIKQNYGNLPRATLNYDMAFLALLLDGLSEDNTSAEVKRCIAHPFNKRPIIINNEAINYAASMNVALSYYKIIDDVNDDNDIFSKCKAIFLSPYNKKFSSSIKLINTVIEENLNKLSKYEQNKNYTSIDEICDPFAIIVGKILEYFPNKIYNDSDEKRNLLYNFGYTLGKWIYLIDALDDLEEDITKGKFNPINYLYNINNLPYKEFKESIKDRLEFNILNCAYNCKDILDELEIKKNKDILDNIISLGMMDKYIKVLNNCKKQKGADLNESI